MDSVVYNLRTRELGQKTNVKKKNKRMLVHSLRKFAEDKGAKPDTNKPFDMSRRAKSTLVLELSPDGKYAASSHGDHSIRISEISSGKCIKTLMGHTRSPWTMSFHGTYTDVLASGCIAGEVRVWDLKSGESDCWSFPDKKAICSVAFHPILPILMIAVMDRIYAWDWTMGRPYHLCTAPKPDQIRWLKFHPTGNWLYTGISNGFVDFTPNSRHTSGNSYFWQFLHGERSRWRTNNNNNGNNNSNNNNNNNNAENNNNDDDNDDDERFRGIFVLGHQPRNPNRNGRGSRRGVFVPSADREESSGDDDDDDEDDDDEGDDLPDDYLVYPTRQRNQENQRRYASPFVNYTRDRSGGEAPARSRTPSRATDYLGQVRDIWQQRLGRRLGHGADGRSQRERGFLDASPERNSSEISGIEERVYRRLNSGLFEHTFRRQGAQRDHGGADRFGPAGGLRDQAARRYMSMFGSHSRDNEEAPVPATTTSSSSLFTGSSGSRGNDSLRRILDVDLHGARLFGTSGSGGTSFQSARADPGRSSARSSSRRSALLRSDPILSDYGVSPPYDPENPTYAPSIVRHYNMEAAGPSHSAHVADSNGEEALVLDLSVNMDAEANVAASSGVASSSSSSVHDSLDQRRREGVGNARTVASERLGDISVAQRSNFEEQTEYTDENYAAAGTEPASETQEEEEEEEDVRAAEGTSMEMNEERDEERPSLSVVQLGTLDDLFAAALGGDDTLPILDQHLPSTSGGRTSAQAEKGAKRRRSEQSSDEECLYNPASPSYRPEEVGESSWQSENSASNSSFAAASSTAEGSSAADTLVNTSSYSGGSGSSNTGGGNVSSLMEDAREGSSSSDRAPSIEGTSRTLPVAVVFTFNSPTLSPTRFGTNPWTSPMPSGQELSRNHEQARRTSPFRSLGRRGDDFVAIGNDPDRDDDDEDNEMDGGGADSIARDHNYIPFSRGGSGGTSRRLDVGLGSAGSEGSLRTDRSSRMTFMETFFLRRRREVATTANRTSTVSRPHAYSLFNPSIRNRFRVPTPPRSSSGGGGGNGQAGGGGSSRRRSFWRFFNSSSTSGRSGIGEGEEDVGDADDGPPTHPQRNSWRRRSPRYLRGRRVSFTNYEDIIGDDDDEDDGQGRAAGASGRSGRRQESDDDIPMFGSRVSSYRLPRATREPDGRSRLFDFNPSFSSADHVSFRIQAWNFNSKVCIDLKKIYKNIVVPYASIHSDASVDISQDGRMLCTFVITEKTQTQRKEVGLFSLEPSTLGACLCLINLDSTAISLSISPNNHYLLVGVSTGRYELSILKPVVCSIYKLRINGDKELTADFISDVTHLSSDWSSNSLDLSINLGANCARWFLGSGEGFVYGTNKGDMVARSHKLYNPELWQKRERENQDRPRQEPGMPWSWFGAGQMRLADFLIWSAQNNMNIGPVIV